MENKKRAVLAIFFIVAVGSVLICYQPRSKTGAGAVTDHFLNREGTLTEATEDTVIHYYIWENEQSYVEPVIEAYLALNPGIQIELHAVDADLYDDNLEALLSGEQQADLVGVRETAHLVELAEKGLLLDLTAAISEYNLEVDSYGNMFNEIRISDRYFGIPARSTCWILLYNKDMFDACQVPYPGQMTWEEYRELAVRMTAGSGGQKQYGGYWPPWCFNFAALQSSSYLIDDDLQLTRKSLEMLNMFYSADGTHMSYQEAADQPERLADLFEKGNIAMMPQGEWIINMIMEKDKQSPYQVNWGIAPMPVSSKKEAGATWGQYQFAAIAADARRPQETFEFLCFLCGEEAARIYAGNGIIPAYLNDEIWEVYGAAIGTDIAEVFRSARRNQEQLAIPKYHEVSDLFNQCADKHLSGEVTLDQAMEEFEALRAELYK